MAVVRYVLFTCLLINLCDSSKGWLDFTQEECLKPDFYLCNDKSTCIESRFVCDSYQNCPDGDDEDNCESARQMDTSCRRDEFKCAEENNCIPDDLVCNGRNDCADGSDESTSICDEIENKCQGFFCKKTRKCLESHTWVCDGFDDCGDGSDEIGCAYDCNPQNKKYLCKDKDTCIDLSKVCDSHMDCFDGSDEDGDCSSSSCESKNCPVASTCKILPSGAECICPKGFKYNKEKNQCIDIDECQEKYGACSQKCINLSGYYSCACNMGFTLQSDNRTCKADGGEPLLLYTTQKTVVGVYLKSKHIYKIAENLVQVVGVAFDGENVFWTNIQHEGETIVKSKQDGSEKEVILTAGLDSPEDIAVDWLTGNLYFSDNIMSHIAVCSKDGHICNVLVTLGVHQPRGLALYPEKGIMFWTDWGDHPMIARASMDGENHKVLIQDDIHWPNGITLDIPNERIYWVDAKLRKLESSKLDGSDRKQILKDILRHPYGIAVFEDQLYWSDWQTKSIHTCDKFSGKNHKIIVKDAVMYDVHIYHSSLQPDVHHACLGNECSHMCLLNENQSYTCVCPEGMVLSTDHRKCVKTTKKQKLYIGSSNFIMEVEHTNFGKHKILNTYILHINVHRLEFNPTSGLIFVADNMGKTIYEFNPAIREIRELTHLFNIKNITDMAFDPLTQILYWSDAGRHTIEALSMKTNQSAIVHFFSGQESPISIAVFPLEGKMFVALESADMKIHIDQISMDGKAGDHLHLIEDELSSAGIRLLSDWDSSMLYWTDTGNGRIEYSNIARMQKHVFRSLLKEPKSITLLENGVFWATNDSTHVFWAHKSNLGTKKKFELPFPKTTSHHNNFEVLATTIPIQHHIAHPCTKNNGGCSHLCVSGGSFRASCLCPPSLIFKNRENKTCIDVEDCEFHCDSGECLTLSRKCNGKIDCIDGSDEQDCDKVQKKRCAVDEFTCHDGSKCLVNHARCDSIVDCDDHSDEDGCETFDHSKMCHNHQFTCENKQCIDVSKICDTFDDCGDGSDEKNCSQKEIKCGEDMFRCTSGTCLPKSWECDGKLDCSDGSDEHSHCAVEPCPAKHFKCTYGKCIAETMQCDGHDDCGDASDELNCDESGKRKIVCGADEYDWFGDPKKFQCTSDPTLCFDMQVRCNGTAECPKGEDEQGCGNCGINEFQCITKGRECLIVEFRCDGQKDCEDGSDEFECESYNKTTHSYAHHHLHFYTSFECAEKGMFDCKDNSCIDHSLVCDGNADCDNGEDEMPMCKTACFENNNPCEHKCNISPYGAICSCFPGYKLETNGKNCTDIDECATISPCSQLCRNKMGSYSCSCFEEFMMTSDRVTCKSITGDNDLLFSTYDEIRSLSPKDVLSIVLATNNSRIKTFDVDVRRQKMFYILEDIDKIYEFDLKQKITLTSLSLASSKMLAIDWITQNIYVVTKDNSMDILKICNFRKTICADIAKLHSRQSFKSLAIDPYNKKIFYSIRQPQSLADPKTILYMSNMDGSNREVLSSKLDAEITTIALDVYKKIVYYTELRTKTIQAIAYTTHPVTSKIVVRKTNAVLNPSSVSVYESHIYIANIGHKDVVKCKLYAEASCDTIPVNVYNVQDLLITGQSRQRSTKANPCENFQCLGICVAVDVKPKCLCEDGSNVSPGEHCENTFNYIHIFDEQHGEENSGMTAKAIFAWIGVMMGILLCIGAVGYYFHHQPMRRHFSHNIHFQNPLSKFWTSGNNSRGSSGFSSATNSLQRIFTNTENGSELVMQTDGPQRGENTTLSAVKFRRSDENVLLEDTDDNNFDSRSLGHYEHISTSRNLL